MKKLIRGLKTDDERALYAQKNCVIKDCEFSGPEDGESALKESKNIEVDGCRFFLRYPMWHVTRLDCKNSFMADTCRAPLWYCKNIRFSGGKMLGTKALRECKGVTLENIEIVSDEFGWRSQNINVYGVKLTSLYPFFESRRMFVEKLDMTAKYSFQYVEDVFIVNSVLSTKDAFWHSKNVTVKDSVVKGEYLGWYSENLTLINCKLSGTQPLCYCKNLKIVDCETEGFDFSFEHSTVDVTVKGNIVSVKNPIGKIVAGSIGEVIKDEYARGDCDITETDE